VQNTSYVVEDPVTTTTTTTLPAVTPEGQISEQEQIYIVVAGDSLSKIASLHGITLEALVNYNEWTDGIAHVILPGAEVRIPPFARVAGTATGGSTGSTGGTGGNDQTTTAPAVRQGVSTRSSPATTRLAPPKYDVTARSCRPPTPATVWNTFLIGSSSTSLPGKPLAPPLRADLTNIGQRRLCGGVGGSEFALSLNSH
jgi:LysM repeat protein